jgi:hypothetical protein
VPIEQISLSNEASTCVDELPVAAFVWEVGQASDIGVSVSNVPGDTIGALSIYLLEAFSR